MNISFILIMDYRQNNPGFDLLRYFLTNFNDNFQEIDSLYQQKYGNSVSNHLDILYTINEKVT